MQSSFRERESKILVESSYKNDKIISLLSRN